MGWARREAAAITSSASVFTTWFIRERITLKRSVAELRTLYYTNLYQIYHKNDPVSRPFESLMFGDGVGAVRGGRNHVQRLRFHHLLST